MFEKDEKEKYICSEYAVNKVLEPFNVQIPISELKKCESLESMIPCVDEQLKDKLVQCKLSTALDLDTIKAKVQKGNRVAIRVRVFNNLHTITISDWKNDDQIEIVDETGSHTTSKEAIEKRRHGTYGFYCNRKGESK